MSADVTAELVDLSDLSTQIVACNATKARSFQENLNEVGSGTLVFWNDDPALASLVTPNTLVNFYLYGVLVYTVLLKFWEANLVATTEEPAETTTWSGPGHLALFDRVIVYPALQLGSRPIEEERSFNWSAAIYDWVGNGAVAATALCLVSDAQTGTWPQPWDTDFAAPGADVLGPSTGSVTAAPVGSCYYQQVVIVLTAGTYQVQVLMDNYGEVFFDGALLMSPGQDTGTAEGFSKTTKRNIDLSPGIHTINARVFNAPFGILNPTGYAFCVAAYNADGTLGTVIAQSEVAGGALIFEYPAEPPGMTPGAIGLLLIGEGQSGTALGGGRATSDALAFVNLVNPTFDDVNDSNGNPWPVVADYATKIGTTLTQVWRELSTYADFWMTPGTLDFNMVIKGDRGSALGVDYHRPTAGPETGNIGSWTAKGEAAVVDALLIRSNVGWTERTDLVALGGIGRIEAPLGLGAISSVDEANRTADDEFLDFAQDRTQNDIKITPAGGDVPYTDVFVGDTPTLEGVPHRLIGMTVSEDETTERAEFVPTFNEGVVLDPFERSQQWLGKMLIGTLGGRSKHAQPIIPVYVPRSLGLGPSDISASCIQESFDKANATTIGPDLTWDTHIEEANSRCEVHDQQYAIGATTSPVYALGGNIRSQGGCGSPDMVVSAVVGDVATLPASTSQQFNVGARVVDKNAPGLAGQGDQWSLGYWLAIENQGVSTWCAGIFARSSAGIWTDVATNVSHVGPSSFASFNANTISALVPGDVLTIKVIGQQDSTVIEGYVNGALVATATVSAAFVASGGGGITPGVMYWLNNTTTMGLDLHHVGGFPTNPVAAYDQSFESCQACAFA